MRILCQADLWSIARKAAGVLALFTAAGCTGHREPYQPHPTSQGCEATAPQHTTDDYIAVEAAHMAAEDQERSAQSPGRRPQPTRRESPIRPTARSRQW
ncbi:MAG: hypothetical protein KAV82_08165 [Phycisphaerae bacterium]|nr:hypothetical protein [Phycisphaerae bacterium]